MRIEILCGSGSPVGVTPSDIYGKNGRVGVGGAELGLLTLCEGWHKAGHEVILYNNPSRNDGIFEQRNVEDFDRVEKTGIVIFFREPTSKVMGIKVPKIFFSCDQYTVGDFKHFAQFVDKVVTISPYHSEYFQRMYGIENSISIDLPVRTWEYEQEIEKVSNRLIFTSVPDRGLGLVAETFPKIKEQVPDTSLVITSDYRLWGAASPTNTQYVQQFMRMKDVQFLGAIPRDKLVQEQLKAQLHYYPCIYEELFCIAVAESQVSGVFPITSDMGALQTTNMGKKIYGDANQNKDMFVSEAVRFLCNPDKSSIQSYLRDKAIKRFSLENILEQWNKRVFNGL